MNFEHSSATSKSVSPNQFLELQEISPCTTYPQGLVKPVSKPDSSEIHSSLSKSREDDSCLRRTIETWGYVKRGWKDFPCFLYSQSQSYPTHPPSLLGCLFSLCFSFYHILWLPKFPLQPPPSGTYSGQKSLKPTSYSHHWTKSSPLRWLQEQFLTSTRVSALSAPSLLGCQRGKPHLPMCYISSGRSTELERLYLSNHQCIKKAV